MVPSSGFQVPSWVGFRIAERFHDDISESKNLAAAQPQKVKDEPSGPVAAPSWSA